MISPKSIVCTLFSLFVAVALVDAASDPADQFLNAYFLIQDGDTAQKANDSAKAVGKYKEALDILQALKKSDPTWNPHIVDYRIKYCSKNIATLSPAGSSAATTAEPGAESMTAIIQGLPTGTELEKIQKLEEELKASRQENLKLRDQLTTIESELKQVKEENTEKINTLNEQNQELAEKLAQAQTQLASMQQRAEAAEAKVAEVEKIRAQFAKLQSTADALEERNKDLEAGSKQMQTELAKLREQFKAAAVPLDKQLRDLKIQNKEMTERLARSEAVSSSMKDVVVSSKTRLRTYEARLDELARQNEKLAAENKGVQKLREEIASLKEKLTTSQSQYDTKLKTLQQQNDALAKRLSDSEKTVVAMQKASVGSSESVKEIQTLRQQLNSARTDLEKSQERNRELDQHAKEYQGQIEKLKTQMAGKSAPVADATGRSPSAAEVKKLQGENARLAALVEQQSRKQTESKAQQEKAAKEMALLEKKYRELQQQLNVRESTEKPPRSEEQALLKQPFVAKPTPAATTSSTPTEPKPAAEPITPPEVTSTPASAPQTPTAAATSPAETAPPADSVKTPETAPTTSTTTEPAGTTPPAAVSPSVPAQSSVPTLASKTAGAQNSSDNLPPELAALVEEGRKLFEAQKFEEAAAKFQEVAEKSPNSSSALSNLAVVRYQTGNLDEAEKLVNRVIEISPDDSYAHSMLGVILYKRQKYDEAITSLTKALSFDPKNAEAHNYLGITCSQKGWQTAAEQELRRAIEIRPDYAEAHFNLAVVYAIQTPPAHDLAREHYQKAQALGMAPDPELERLLPAKPSS